MPSANVLLISAQPADKARVADALHAIRGQPYRLEVASTLTDGLARLKQGRVDAILLDLNLPDSAGLTTFLRVQPKATHVPIVVLVGEQSDETGTEAVQRGALDFLVREQLTPSMVERVLRYATERTHTLLALKASEQRYRELFQNVTAGVFQTTADGKFMAANPALIRMLGYDSEDELLDLEISRDVYMEPDHRQNWVRAMQRGRRSPQRGAPAQASRRIEDRRARELACGVRHRRQRAVLRRHADRHHGCARAFAAALVRREPRRADRAWPIDVNSSCACSAHSR